jgi:hypothetical protein
MGEVTVAILPCFILNIHVERAGVESLFSVGGGEVFPWLNYTSWVISC